MKKILTTLSLCTILTGGALLSTAQAKISSQDSTLVTVSTVAVNIAFSVANGVVPGLVALALTAAPIAITQNGGIGGGGGITLFAQEVQELKNDINMYDATGEMTKVLNSTVNAVMEEAELSEEEVLNLIMDIDLEQINE